MNVKRAGFFNTYTHFINTIKTLFNIDIKLRS